MARPGPKAKKKVEKKVEEPTSVMTPEQRAIAERIAGETDDWKMLTERDMEDFSLMENPFKLPPPAQKMVDDWVIFLQHKASFIGHAHQTVVGSNDQSRPARERLGQVG